MSDKNAPEAEVTEAPAWHCMDKAAVIKQLGLGADHESTGLSSTDAKARLDKYGPNKMTEEKKKTLLERIWDQVANVLVAILIVVALVSMVRAIVEDGTENKISNWIQFGIIFSVIAINTYIGIYQEGNAEKAAEALKSMLSSDARVLRDGKEMMIPGIDVVPGDVVILGLGDKIPCDLRLLKTQNLACQEAALTGESVPIDKVTETIEAPEGLTPAQVPSVIARTCATPPLSLRRVPASVWPSPPVITPRSVPSTVRLNFAVGYSLRIFTFAYPSHKK